MGEQWEERARPSRLERTYRFDNYTQLRDFLDRAAEISEEIDLYPDMGFGRDYVNITIHTEEGCEQVEDRHREFAKRLDGIGGYQEAE